MRLFNAGKFLICFVTLSIYCPSNKSNVSGNAFLLLILIPATKTSILFLFKIPIILFSNSVSLSKELVSTSKTPLVTSLALVTPL